MPTYPVILDARPAYVGGGPAIQSLLAAPLGRSTLLAELLRRVKRVTQEAPTVLPAFDPPPGYSDAIEHAAGRKVRVVPQAKLDELLFANEPSDTLLIVDPSCFPETADEWVEAVRVSPPAGAARHIVHVSPRKGGTRECVHVDADDRVRRIQRYYDGFTWMDTVGVSCTLVSVAVMRSVAVRRIERLSDLRAALTAEHVLCSDAHLADGAYDLSDAPGFVRLNERTIRKLIDRDEPTGDGRARLMMGEGCEIHASARLHGRVLLQDGAQIKSGAVVIGPALIGRNAIVGSDAVVAQGVVLPGSRVRSGLHARCGVVNGDRVTELSDCASCEVAERAPKTGEVQPASQSTYAKVKVVIDAVVAAVSLLALSPLLAIVALLVKLDSRGPVFFPHIREGRGGKAFRCWKFRTMCADAHAMQRQLYARSNVDGPQFKMDNDPRITRVGRILRSTNIDELPQLYNVMMGQMSLIGPRPSPFRENQICVPWRDARLSVRPGITGLWQLCRHDREAGDFHQWIYFDMLYVKHMSFRLDVRILVGTLLTMGGRWSLPVERLIPDHLGRPDLYWPTSASAQPIVEMSAASVADEEKGRSSSEHQAA